MVALEKIFPCGMVSKVAMESMHGVSGGTCKDYLVRISDTSKATAILSKTQQGVLDKRFKQMRPCFIKEFARALRQVNTFI